MIKLATALCLIATAAEPELKFPNWWAWYRAGFACGSVPYFQCDYTAKTCMSGRQSRNTFIGVILAEDRQTVVAHVMCTGGTCINFDTGDGTGVGWFLGDKDQSPDEVRESQDRAMRKCGRTE
jgi:hypothetical protein